MFFIIATMATLFLVIDNVLSSKFHALPVRHDGTKYMCKCFCCERYFFAYWCPQSYLYTKYIILESVEIDSGKQCEEYNPRRCYYNEYDPTDILRDCKIWNPRTDTNPKIKL